MPRVALFLLLCSSLFAQVPTQELTIPAIFAEGSVTGRPPESVKWSPDNSRISYVLRDDSGEHGQLYYFETSGTKPAVLVASEKLSTLVPPESQISRGKDDRERERRERYSIAGYHWAPDGQHLLFDSKGQLWLFSLKTGTAVQFTSAGDPSEDPKFSPDGKRVAYVRKHNLYSHPIEGENETQLTQGTDENNLNGEVDWVYGEELGVRSNFFWSPDSKHIVFLQMNEFNVPEYPIEDFIPQHPTVDKQKYPKAGDPNPEVRVSVIDAGGGKPHWLKLSDALEKDRDYYIPRFGWVTRNVVWVQVLNRQQNQLDLYFYDLTNNRSQLMLTEKTEPWIEMDDNFYIFKSADRFLWSSWRDGHTHLYLYSFDGRNPIAAQAKLTNQVTKGDFEVFAIDGVDEGVQTVFFTANEGDARQRQLYAVKFDGSGMRRISKEPGTHAATFADNNQYFVDNFSALITPPQMSMCKLDGKCQIFWQSRDVAGLKLEKPQFVDFKAEDGTVLHGLLQLPSASATTPGVKAPVLLNPYGGPQGQSVQDQWGGPTLLFNNILARDGIAVLTVDNRGSGARGKAFASVLHNNFGENELKDQLTALDQAVKQFPQLDGSRVGFWGWSYGGFMTLYALTHSDRFHAGFAVAPVTDWKNYDTIYTERYMGIPRDNVEGYKKSSPVNSAASLSGNLVIAHGTSDDNVHMQNTVQMVQALIAANKQYSLLVYPRKTHGIAGAAARTHLFERIRAHFNQYLLGRSLPQQPSAQAAPASKEGAQP